jgi:hypothetical protein
VRKFPNHLPLLGLDIRSATFRTKLEDVVELAHLVYGANLPEKLSVEELDTHIAYGGLLEGVNFRALSEISRILSGTALLLPFVEYL